MTPFAELGIQTICPNREAWAFGRSLLFAMLVTSGGFFVNSGLADDEIAESLEADKRDYVAECEEAHQELLDKIDSTIEIYANRTSGDLDEQLITLKNLREAKEKCENDPTFLPESPALFKAVRVYKSKRERASKQVQADFRAAAKRYHRAGDLQRAKKTLDAMSEYLRSANAQVTYAEITFPDSTVLTKFANGERVFDNRGYVWQDLPTDIPFTQATLDRGGSRASVSFEVNVEGNLFIAVPLDVVAVLNDDGWHVTNMHATYNDRDRTKMPILRRKLAAGPHTISDTGWVGPIILLP